MYQLPTNFFLYRHISPFCRDDAIFVIFPRLQNGFKLVYPTQVKTNQQDLGEFVTFICSLLVR